MTNEELMRKYFEADKFALGNGIEIIEVTEGKAVLAVTTDARHKNANDVVQGGMLYTLADFAFAVQSNFLHPKTVTQCGTITYLAPAPLGRLIATAVEVTRVGHNSVSDVTVTDEKGNVVCECRFNGFVKDVDRKIFEP